MAGKTEESLGKDEGVFNLGVCRFIVTSTCFVVRLLPTVLSYLTKFFHSWHTLKRQTTGNGLWNGNEMPHKGRGKRERATDLEDCIFV